MTKWVFVILLLTSITATAFALNNEEGYSYGTLEYLDYEYPDDNLYLA